MAISLLAAAGLTHADTTLLNASYDVTREFYKDYILPSVNTGSRKPGNPSPSTKSHGGSSKQVRSVTDGLGGRHLHEPEQRIHILFERGKLIPADWQKRLLNASSPTTSTTVFLVRKGNPKNIKDWDDLLKPGVGVIIPNPKTSDNGRYSYLAAWGTVIKKSGDETKARDFITQLFKNVPVLDAGGRGATTTFVQRGIGNVLLTFEKEVFLISKELGNNNFDVVYPSSSILAENPVSLVDKVVDKRKTV